VPGGERDQVREALERDGVAVVHELGDRVAQASSRAIAVRYVNTPSLRAQRIIGAVCTPPHADRLGERTQGSPAGAGNHHEGEQQMATTDLAEQQLLINGEWRAAGSGDTFSRLNPYTGEPATTASAGGRADAHAAVDAAHAAFAQWSQTGPASAARSSRAPPS
jgi:hypothetical protein